MWPVRSRRTAEGDKLWLNKVGSFGISSAANHWSRLMSGLGRAVYCTMGKSVSLLSHHFSCCTALSLLASKCFMFVSCHASEPHHASSSASSFQNTSANLGPLTRKNSSTAVKRLAFALVSAWQLGAGKLKGIEKNGPSFF